MPLHLLALGLLQHQGWWSLLTDTERQQTGFSARQHSHGTDIYMKKQQPWLILKHISRMKSCCTVSFMLIKVYHKSKNKKLMKFMLTLAASHTTLPAISLLLGNTLTWAILWCCSLITRDTAICMLPNTATTSKILSSNDGAPNIWR